MEIKLTKTESEEIFFNALCNGLAEVTSYGLEFVYDSNEYKLAKDKLKEEDPDNQLFCFEDVVFKILKMGGSIGFVDEEGEDSWNITLNDIYERMNNVPVEHLLSVLNETDDAYTADAILQTIFFGETIYG